MQAPRNNYTIREGSLEATKEEDGAAEATAAGHPGQRPDIRHLCSRPTAAPTVGRTSLSGRTSGANPGHPAPPDIPDIWHLPRKSGIDVSREQLNLHLSQDIRPRPRTSGSS